MEVPLLVLLPWVTVSVGVATAAWLFIQLLIALARSEPAPAARQWPEPEPGPARIVAITDPEGWADMVLDQARVTGRVQLPQLGIQLARLPRGVFRLQFHGQRPQRYVGEPAVHEQLTLAARQFTEATHA